MKCPRCRRRMSCPRCTGAAVGVKGSVEGKSRGGKASAAARWKWRAGDHVTARVIAKRTWEAVIVDISAGEPGRRVLKVLMVKYLGSDEHTARRFHPYNAHIKESLVARVKP